MIRKNFCYAAAALACSLFLSGALTGCGSRAQAAVSAEQESSEETESASEAYYADEIYEESIAVDEAEFDNGASPYYGVMYVSVLDVSGNSGDSDAVYSFKDKKDPENAWSVTGLEIGDIEADMTPGADVAVLFHGDVIRDADNIEFIAVLPDGEYTLKQAEGTTLSNTMSSFVIETSDGGSLSFLKDNCSIENDAMQSDSGDRIRVYYADGGALGNFPLSVFKLD